jgi:hypothetical protein
VNFLAGGVKPCRRDSQVGARSFFACSKQPDLITVAQEGGALAAGFAGDSPERQFMAIRGLGHRNLLAERSWLWLICLFCLPSRCFAQTYEGFSYTNSGTNITITGYAGPGGAVTIPSSIPGVSGTVTAIGFEAFFEHELLTGVAIPSSVTSIGYQAFGDCPGLTSITIPNSVTNIGAYAFDWCVGLTSVTFPGSVTSIGEYAFDTCWNLTSVTFPNSVTNIGNGAFYNCSDLTNLAIPNSATNIGAYAFDGCVGLTSVTIPSSVMSIGDSAFGQCSGLTSVSIPSSVTSIGRSPFSGCTNLTAIPVDPKNPAYGSLNGVLFDKTQSLLVEYPAGLAPGAYAIPTSVTSIEDAAFSKCSGLTSVTIPSSVTNIGYGAFGWCSGLTNVTIPDSVASIGNSAFFNCDRLATAALPSRITSIQASLFADCTRLTSIFVPGSVTSIGQWAFVGCASLTSVTLPTGVSSIGDEAFQGCTNLTSAYFQGNAPSVFGVLVFAFATPQFSIYYPSCASGWTTPTWNGYPAQPYACTPGGQPPVLALALASGAVTPSFNYLPPGTNYQLQVSSDLSTWTNTGPVFTATNASETYAQPFEVRSSPRLFFRLLSAP